MQKVEAPRGLQTQLDCDSMQHGLFIRPAFGLLLSCILDPATSTRRDCNVSMSTSTRSACAHATPEARPREAEPCRITCPMLQTVAGTRGETRAASQRSTTSSEPYHTSPACKTSSKVQMVGLQTSDPSAGRIHQAQPAFCGVAQGIGGVAHRKGLQTCRGGTCCGKHPR